MSGIQLKYYYDRQEGFIMEILKQFFGFGKQFSAKLCCSEFRWHFNSPFQKYQGLLEDFRALFPEIFSPATPTTSSAKELARREGDSVHDQYQRIKQDVDRLIVM